MNDFYTEISKCRVCNSSDLTSVIKIEDQHLSPTFVKSNEGNLLADVKVPHTLVLCEHCGLLQLKETVHADLLYKQYFYRSAVSDTMRKDLHDVVTDVTSRVRLDPEDVVVDIGANDCTMLSWFPSDCHRIAVEPAENIDWSGVDPTITIVNDYFSLAAIKSALDGRKVKAFTSCAMFYDLDDPNSFVKDIRESLHDEGVWCIQLSYLPAMLKNLNFYDICNEHLEYYSLDTLNYLMKKNDLEIFDASENDVNGGSVRVMITHKSKNVEKTEQFLAILKEERSMSLRKAETYTAFHRKIIELKNKVGDVIDAEIDKGNKVIGLGASTKGNMLLQLFGLGKDKIPYISERNPSKVGLRTLGTDIELISESRARSLTPSCMLVLPWYFKNEIVDRESDYIKGGGSLLFPMPYPHLVHKHGETKL